MPRSDSRLGGMSTGTAYDDWCGKPGVILARAHASACRASTQANSALTERLPRQPPPAQRCVVVRSTRVFGAPAVLRTTGYYAPPIRIAQGGVTCDPAQRRG